MNTWFIPMVLHRHRERSFGYYVITNQYYKRYRLPIMHTETNIKMPACKEWLLKQWANVHRLKHDGVPVHRFHLVQPAAPG
jgi:hypothetical protein